MVDAGMPVVEQYRPVVWVRSQFRCLSGSLEHADRIARGLQFFLNGLTRTLVVQPSTGETYLVHSVTVSAGPSTHYDSPETWEYLLFTESLIGTEPI
jgi:hypothetical protein